MFIKWLMLGTVLFNVCIFTSTAWRPYEAKLTSVVFHSANDLLSVNFTLKDSVFDAWIDVREYIQHVYVHLVVYLDLGNGKYDFEFMNRTIDLCRLLRDSKYEPFAQIIYRSVWPYCNCPKRCPIPKKLYYLKQLRISTEYFPPVFPERKAFIVLNYLRKIDQKLELLGTSSVFASMEKTYKTKGKVSG